MLDCIVVGSGPAGGSAAYHLAKRGRSVLILEREALPRYKPCSGGVSPAIAAWFDFDFSPVIVQKVDTIRYTWKVGDPVETALNTPEPMWMVQRDRFDQYVVDQAKAVGAQVQDQTEVLGIEFKVDHWVVNTSQGPMKARYLVAADGAKGPMAQWLGFAPRVCRMGAVLEVPAASCKNQAQFDFGMLKNGFIWQFPKGDRYSIGTGILRGKDDQNLHSVLAEYTHKLGIDISQAKVYEHPICLWEGDENLHAQNALLAGEAAGVLDPMTAEGIRPSMFSGVKAAEAIDLALAGDAQALVGYTRTMQEEWGKDMAWAQKLAGIFYRVPNIGYKVGVKRPSATDRLGKILCGELRYADVANRALKKMGGGLIPGLG